MTTNSTKNTDPAPIVCGTDFSNNAREAATVAALIAKKLNVPLKLVYTHKLMTLGITSLTLPSYPSEAIEKSHRESLNKECIRLEKLGATVDGIISEARSPCDSLLQIISEYKARLVLVAWHGANSNWHIGSVAERLVQLSPIPTLVIQKATPFTLWLEKDIPLKVFIGVDFSISSDHALRWVKALQDIGPCQITAAYIDQPAAEETRLGLSGSYLHIGNMPTLQKILERDLREKVSEILESDNTNTNIIVEGDWGSQSHALLKLAKENHAELIVLGTHQRHGINKLRKGSISQDVLHNAPASIACIPARSAESSVSPKIHRFKRVIAAIDLNEPHGFAAAHAYSIVDPGGEVLLFNNITPFKPNPFIQDYLSKKLPSKKMNSLEDQLHQLAPQEANELGIKTTAQITEKDNTAEAICHAAELFNADAICIGSHTRPGLTAKVLGSVALAVLQKVRRPVLLVWPPN